MSCIVQDSRCHTYSQRAPSKDPRHPPPKGQPRGAGKERGDADQRPAPTPPDASEKQRRQSHPATPAPPRRGAPPRNPPPWTLQKKLQKLKPELAKTTPNRTSPHPSKKNAPLATVGRHKNLRVRSSLHPFLDQERVAAFIRIVAAKHLRESSVNMEPTWNPNVSWNPTWNPKPNMI